MNSNLTKVDLYKAVLSDTKEIIGKSADKDLKKELFRLEKDLFTQIDLYKKAFANSNSKLFFSEFMINFLDKMENCLISFQEVPDIILGVDENDIYSSYAFLWCILYNSHISKIEDIKTFKYDNMAQFSAFLNKLGIVVKIRENYEKYVIGIINGEISLSKAKNFLSELLENGALTTIKKKKKYRSKKNKTKKVKEKKEEELKEEEKKEDELKEMTKEPNEEKKEDDKIEVKKEKEEDLKEGNIKEDETKLRTKENGEVNEIREREETKENIEEEKKEENKEKEEENKETKEEEKEKEGKKEGDGKVIIEGRKDTNEEKAENEKEGKEKKEEKNNSNIINETEKENTNNLVKSQEERITYDQLVLIVKGLRKDLDSTNQRLEDTNYKLSEANNKISQHEQRIKNLENNQKLLFYQLSMYQARDISKNIYYYFCKYLYNKNGQKPFSDLLTIMDYFNKGGDEKYTPEQQKILRKFFRVIFFINKANNRILHNNLSSAVKEAIEKKKENDLLSLLPPNNYAQLFETLKNYLDLNLKNEQFQEALRYVYENAYIHDDKIEIIRENDFEAIKKENDSIKFLITKDEIDEAKKLFDVIKIGNETFEQVCNAKTYESSE